MKAECWRVQAGWGVVDVRLFDPEEWDPVLALLAFSQVPGLITNQQYRHEEDAEDGEGVEEDEIEERVAGADDRLECGCWIQTEKRKEKNEKCLVIYAFPCANLLLHGVT